MEPTTIDNKRLANLSKITLHAGSHAAIDKAFCAMEAVAWLAREPTRTRRDAHARSSPRSCVD
jgi:hypothetical protein